MVKNLILLLVFATVSLASADVTKDGLSFDLKFDGPATINASGKEIKITGPFFKASDGKQGLVVGSNQDQPWIPASDMVGEKATILVTFMSKPVKPENFLKNRSILVLRGQGRERISFGQPGNSKSLQFAFRKFTDPKTFVTSTPIEFNRWYQAVCTWDGLTVKLFLDGVLQTEFPQPYAPKFPVSSTFLYLGPYKDGYTNFKAWNEDSCVIREIKVYKRALAPGEVMAAAGRKAVDASKQFNSFLAVPQVTETPVLDGKLNDDVWQRASSFVTLVDGQKQEESFSYKGNNPKFCHDGKNLYVGFKVVFPAGYNMVMGEIRSEKEPEVWANESFEFYLDIDGRFYRFAGNAAGGYCESLNSDTAFDGCWQYKTITAMQIDNCVIWQGEISIPFDTIGVSSPVGRELKVNFCRTWRGRDRIGLTSLSGAGSYNKTDRFATLKISDNDTAFQELAVNDPNYATLEQKFQVFSRKNVNLEYTVKLLSSGGFVPERSLMKKTIEVKADVLEKIDTNKTIESTSYDRLLFQVTDTTNSQLLMQQVVPFKVIENYLDVIPAFSSAKVFMKPRYALVKSKTAGNPVQVEVVSPSSKTIFTTTISSDDEFSAPFARDNETGIYHALICSVIDGKKKVFTSRAFNYHGVGLWEKTIPEHRVLLPFEPLTVKGEKGTFDIGMWGRVYGYKKSLLPTIITALNQPVLAASSFTINGTEVSTPLKVTKAEPYRLELTGNIASAGFDLEQNSWIEYDGFLWNSIKLKAKENLTGVRLKLDIPESMAKFYHATKSGFGGGGRRTAAIDGDVDLSFWPVIWIGGEEQGLCWFAETNKSWKTSETKPIRIVRGKNQTSLEITFADELGKGQDIKIDFGLIATPVKPLPKSYPFTMLSSGYPVHLNFQPPRAPTIATVVGQASNVGQGFFDMTFHGAADKDYMEQARAELDRCQKNNVIWAPYQPALYLPEEYQIVKDNLQEWQVAPENHLTSKDFGRSYVYYNLCPASKAANYYLYRFRELVKNIKIKGVYFDFGPAYTCSNRYHGCNGGYQIRAKREFYKRVAGILADANDGDYTIAVHASESVQIPTFTFATHFFNGEGLRQMSSSVFHDGKDLLDHYTIVDFASEHSSLPWGITASIYCPTDPLRPEFGGEKNGGAQELYRFRMTKAVMAGALIHNTIPSQSRNHYGWYDKVTRFYDDFKINQAEFLPYWRNSEYVRVVQGKDIYVSFYRHPEKKEILAVISHVSKEHLDQDVVVEFDPANLGFSRLISAMELLTGPDPEYQRLYAETNRWRIPVELGDFGVKFNGLANNQIKLNLKHHSVAIVKITAE